LTRNSLSNYSKGGGGGRKGGKEKELQKLKKIL
jgi:hypothetical protein